MTGMDRRAISNIAWGAEHDGEALDLAAELGFAGIEIAPGKVFGPLDAMDTSAPRRYRQELAARGLVVPALQAILFGATDAHLFTSPEARSRLRERLEAVAALAGELEAGACVFGAPKLRDPGEMPADDAWRTAAAFFADLAPRFAERGTSLCFEANPPIYDCRFVTGTLEAIALVEVVGREGFDLQLDMGTVFANAEADEVVERAGGIARHCHVSEPGLAPLGTAPSADHARTGRALAASGYGGWISVEMRAVDDRPGAMRRAAALVAEHYGGRSARG